MNVATARPTSRRSPCQTPWHRPCTAVAGIDRATSSGPVSPGRCRKATSAGDSAAVSNAAASPIPVPAASSPSAVPVATRRAATACRANEGTAPISSRFSSVTSSA